MIQIIFHCCSDISMKMNEVIRLSKRWNDLCQSFMLKTICTSKLTKTLSYCSLKSQCTHRIGCSWGYNNLNQRSRNISYNQCFCLLFAQPNNFTIATIFTTKHNLQQITRSKPKSHQAPHITCKYLVLQKYLLNFISCLDKRNGYDSWSLCSLFINLRESRKFG